MHRLLVTQQTFARSPSAHLGLSQLVVVVGEAQVEAATVDVHGLAQDGACHG